jgi:hypothetical protein
MDRRPKEERFQGPGPLNEPGLSTAPGYAVVSLRTNWKLCFRGASSPTHFRTPNLIRVGSVSPSEVIILHDCALPKYKI